MADPPDRDLVARVLAAGDETAFRLLYRRHTPGLLRTARRIAAGASAVAVEDLVHDTWIRASDRLARFEWRSSLSTWLTGILINRFREARREWAGANLALEEVPEPAADAVPLDDRLDLEDAIAQLPDGYRAAIVLHDIEGHTHEEVAELLGIAIGTSKSQLARARQALRRWLEPGVDPT